MKKIKIMQDWNDNLVIEISDKMFFDIVTITKMRTIMARIKLFNNNYL